MQGKFRMHTFTLSFVLSTLLSTVALAQAATPASGAPAPSVPATGATKIGIVNIQDAIVATNEGKKEFDGLQTRFAPKQAELKNMNDEVDTMKKQLQATGDKLNDDERSTRVKTLEVKQKNLQRNFEDAQAEFQQAEQEVVNRIGQKMLAVLEKYARTNGFSMVLDVSNPQSPVLYAGEGTNITKDLVDAYNAESPVTAPPSTKPPATRPAGTIGAPTTTRPSGTGATTTRPPATGAAPTPKKP